MVNHIWSVICRRSVVDNDTNNISLFDILEQLTIEVKQKQEVAFPKQLSIPIEYEIVSFWMKDKNDGDFKGQAKIDILNPEGKLMKTFEQILEMPSKMKRLRSRFRINGFVAEHTGIYNFVISYKYKDKEYKKLVELPLEVIVKRQEDQNSKIVNIVN